MTHWNIKVDNTTAIACQANWTAGSAGSSFGFAAKRRLNTGADVHVKTNMAGNVDVAHVSVSLKFEFYHSRLWFSHWFEQRTQPLQFYLVTFYFRTSLMASNWPWAQTSTAKNSPKVPQPLAWALNLTYKHVKNYFCCVKTMKWTQTNRRLPKSSKSNVPPYLFYCSYLFTISLNKIITS